jgi:hypothetical protein
MRSPRQEMRHCCPRSHRQSCPPCCSAAQCAANGALAAVCSVVWLIFIPLPRGASNLNQPCVDQTRGLGTVHPPPPPLPAGTPGVVGDQGLTVWDLPLVQCWVGKDKAVLCVVALYLVQCRVVDKSVTILALQWALMCLWSTCASDAGKRDGHPPSPSSRAFLGWWTQQYLGRMLLNE